MQRTLRSTLVACAVAAGSLTAATAAHAGSAVYIKGGNVFIADVNGANEHQVTTIGTNADVNKTAFRSPSEADDGTIFAARGAEIWHLAQNGVVLSHGIPTSRAYPLSAQVSPDGSRIAYNYSFITQCVTWDDLSCGFDPSPGASMDLVGGQGSSSMGGVDFAQDPQWVGNTGVVLQTNSGWVDYFDVATETTVRWVAPGDTGEYVDQPTVSRSGKLFGVIIRSLRSGGNPSADDVLQIWKTNGPPAKDPANHPTPLCAFNAPNGDGFSDPRFTLDDSAVTWGDSKGVETEAIDGDCTGAQYFDLTLDPVLIAGASQLSFGVAANAPGPLPVQTPKPGAAPTGGGAAGGTGTSSIAAPAPISLSPLADLKAMKLGKSGVKATVLCAAACKFTATIEASHKVAKGLGLKGKGDVALGSAKGSSGPGGTEVTVKLTKTAKAALAHRLHEGKKLALTLTVKTRQDGGNHQSASVGLTVKG